MKLYIQDPKFLNSYTTHEALLNACENTCYGAGVYAFVTGGGVKLFLDDVKFEELMKNGRYKLIVGTDEITSEKALIELSKLKEKYKGNLEVKAFLNNTKGSLFHPKFSWFKKKNGGIIVLGSSNLTEKGLRKNREAFVATEVSEVEINDIETTWNEWLNYNSNLLHDIDEEVVINRVRENIIVYSGNKKNSSKQENEDDSDISDKQNLKDNKENENTKQENILLQDNEEEDLEAWKTEAYNEVLITQIPNNNIRWKQANFHKDLVTDFFGVTPGDKNQRLLLKNIDKDGKIHGTEIRYSVSVKSSNFRIELSAASGQGYPNGEDRPIGIFIKVSTRMFVYVLAMPAEDYYNEVKSFLYDNNTSKGNHMRRYLCDVQTLNNKCPKLPIWNSNI